MTNTEELIQQFKNLKAKYNLTNEDLSQKTGLPTEIFESFEDETTVTAMLELTSKEKVTIEDKEKLIKIIISKK